MEKKVSGSEWLIEEGSSHTALRRRLGNRPQPVCLKVEGVWVSPNWLTGFFTDRTYQYRHINIEYTILISIILMRYKAFPGIERLGPLGNGRSSLPPDPQKISPHTLLYSRTPLLATYVSCLLVKHIFGETKISGRSLCTMDMEVSFFEMVPPLRFLNTARHNSFLQIAQERLILRLKPALHHVITVCAPCWRLLARASFLYASV